MGGVIPAKTCEAGSEPGSSALILVLAFYVIPAEAGIQCFHFPHGSQL